MITLVIFRLHDATWGVIFTCRVVCEGLAGDASGWLLEGVGGGGGRCAGAGVVTCHVG